MWQPFDRDSQRLTPFSRSGLIYPVLGLMGVFLIVAGERVGLLSLLIMIAGTIRFLRTGIFASAAKLRVGGGATFTVRWNEVAGFAVRRDERKPRTLWVDLTDGRRYPTPVGLDKDKHLIVMSQPQLDALIANLEFRRAAATGQVPTNTAA
ncbi:hypothetical protein [Catellatospora sp. TT07R-123]|uniref:hypothetical protein n=1 Tax=Catellatospora sp. TT07R-123 TaxID=2733863 RepID=UPI001BB407F9|nr:hypothetical protein [Catellatospora sp. TT07R-123]